MKIQKPDDFVLTDEGSILLDSIVARLQAIGELAKKISNKNKTNQIYSKQNSKNYSKQNNKNLFIKLTFLVSIVALVSAFFIEYILGHQPCNLCILERFPYLLAIIIILFIYLNIKIK